MTGREPQQEIALAEIDLDSCPVGPVLDPLQPRSESDARAIAGWETPLAPWSGFKGGSRLAVVREEDRSVLASAPRGPWDMDSALVWGDPEIRDCRIVADVLPVDTTGEPDFDRWDCTEALGTSRYTRSSAGALPRPG